MAKEFSVFVNIAGRLDKSLPAAVAAARSSLATLGRQLAVMNTGAAAAFASAARKLDTAGKRLGETGRNVTARVSTPAGLLGFGAGKMAFEFEKAGNMLEALGDATEKQRKEFEAYANVLNKKYPQTLAGIISTGNEMLKGGFSFDQMKGAIDQTLATAVLGEMTPAEVGNMMARTINSFQLPMKTYQDAMRSSQRVSDQMTFAAVKTTASLRDMGEMYRYVGGAASAGGISLEQASAFAMAFAKNGSVGSDAGVALRSAIVRLVKMPPKALGALEGIGMKLGDYVGGGRKVTADNILSGLQADGIDASPVRKQIEKALNDKKLAGSTVQLSGAITKLVQGAMANAGSALDASTIATSVQESITAAGSKIDLVKFFGDLKKKFDTGQATLGDVATILEGRHASRYMAILQSDLPALIKQIETESEGYTQARYSIMLKGIVGAVYEIGAAVEAFSVALGRAGFPTIAQGLGHVTAAINAAADASPRLLKFGVAVGLAAVALGPFLIAAGATVRVAGLLARGLGLLGTVATLGLATRLVAVAGGIKAIAVASTLAAVGRLRALAAGVIALAAVGGSRAVLAALAASFLKLGKAILLLPLTMFKGAFVGLAAIISPVGIAVTAVVAALAALGVWCYNNLSGIGTFFTSFGSAFMKALGPETAGHVSTVVGWLGKAWDWLSKLLGPIDESGAKWAQWGESAGRGAAAVVNALADLPGKIGALAKAGYDALVNFDWGAAGKALIDKIASGITEAAGGLAKALTGAVSSAWDAAKARLGFGGDSAAAKPDPSASSAPSTAGRKMEARANGGPVTGGLPYLVGERGPEIFMPAGAGRIETNRTLNALVRAGAASGEAKIGVDASAVERAGEAAKRTGGELRVALDPVRKPIVDTTSIDAAIVKAEKLKNILAAVGSGNISLPGGSAQWASLGGGSGGGGAGAGAGGGAAASAGRAVGAGRGGGGGAKITGPVAGAPTEGLRGEVRSYMRSVASANGIDPNVWERVMKQESGFNPYAKNISRAESSYGVMQLNTKGGLGNVAERQGINPRDPSRWREHIDFSARIIKKDGWRQWYGARDVGISRWQGISGARAAGGPVARGLSYLVGENGPEVFTPGASGQITRNDTLNRLAALGRRTMQDGESGIAPPAALVAKLRPQGGNVSTRGDTTYAPTFQINGAQDPTAIRREVEEQYYDMIRQAESEQLGLLSD